MAPPGGFINFDEMMSHVSFVNLAIKKGILSVLIASKTNNFKMLPLYEVGDLNDHRVKSPRAVCGR